MKHIMRFVLIALVFCFVFPITVFADTYNISDTDLSVCVDDTSWYVFTRDNLLNNSELEELGITYDYMHSVLYDNMAYMDAILLYEDGEFLELVIRKKAIDNSFTNLSNYSNEQLLEVAAEFGQRQNTENFSVYESQYKFIRLEYFDSNYDFYICEFITMVNKDNYTLTFQSPSPLTEWELDEIEEIVDSVCFNVDPSIEEPIPMSVAEQKTPSLLGKAAETYITSAISGGVLAVIVLIFSKRKKARKAKKNDKAPDAVPDHIPELKNFWYENGCIFAEFQSGRIMKYIGVPDKNYRDMCDAPKKSKYLFGYIIGIYEAEEVKKSDSNKPLQVQSHDVAEKESFEDLPENINESQVSPFPKDDKVDKSYDDKFDDIKKYKELLDLGIITQEEFASKKKELLNL